MILWADAWRREMPAPLSADGQTAPKVLHAVNNLQKSRESWWIPYDLCFLEQIAPLHQGSTGDVERDGLSQQQTLLA